MDARRLIDALAMVDEDHFAIVTNDRADIYSNRDFYATPHSRFVEEKTGD